MRIGVRDWVAARSLATAALVTTSLALAGCGSAEAPARPASTADEASLSGSFNAVVTIAVDGALTLGWEREGPLDIMKMTPARREVHLLSMGFRDFVAVADGPERFRWAFDLVGGYDGPGTYQISGAAADAEGEGEPGDLLSDGLMSSTFFIYLELTDPSLEDPFVAGNYDVFRLFDQVRRPCVIEVGEDEATGSLTCPELADSEGNRINLLVTWRAEND